MSVASAAAGFVYGASHREKQTPHERPTNTEGRDQSIPSDDDDESIADGDLSAVTAGFMQPCKLVRCSTISYLMPLTDVDRWTFLG